MNDNSKLIGQNGGRFYDATATLTGDWYAIEMNADSVLSVLRHANFGDSSTDDALAGWGISGKTLSQGVIITPQKDAFKSVAVTSGSVILRSYK